MIIVNNQSSVIEGTMKENSCGFRLCCPIVSSPSSPTNTHVHTHPELKRIHLLLLGRPTPATFCYFNSIYSFLEGGRVAIYKIVEGQGFSPNEYDTKTIPMDECMNEIWIVVL